MLSVRKILGEEKLLEVKNILGWTINTRSFTILLDENKFLRWNKEIQELINLDKPVQESCLESIIGNGFINPLIRYFLTWLRYRLKIILRKGSQQLTTWDKEDLKLICTMLHKTCYSGICIDHVTFCCPSLLTISDASEYGMGGFCSEGFAWRYQLPPHLIDVFFHQ